MSHAMVPVAAGKLLTIDAVRQAPPQEMIALATSQGIRDVMLARAVFEAASKVAIVCAPTLTVGALPAKTALKISVVSIDARAEKNQRGYPEYPGKEIYKDSKFCKGDDVALTKNALLRLLSAAGISIVRLWVEPLERYRWIGHAILQRRSLTDGLPEQSQASREVDLTDGAPDAQKPEKDKSDNLTGRLVALDASALGQARRHGPANAETKALLRAFRGFPGLGIKQAYSLRELQEKPFMFASLVPEWDPNDRDDMNFARALAAGASGNLFGRDDRALTAGPAAEVRVLPEVPDDEPGAGTAQPGAQASDPVSDDDLGDLEPPPPPPPAEDAKPLLCGCACGHQAEIDAGTAHITMERLGIQVCGQCAPGPKFNEQTHAELKRLNFPKVPHLNDPAAAIKAAREARAKQQAKK